MNVDAIEILMEEKKVRPQHNFDSISEQVLTAELANQYSKALQCTLLPLE
jgi:hypothetical protein